MLCLYFDLDSECASGSNSSGASTRIQGLAKGVKNSEYGKFLFHRLPYIIANTIDASMFTITITRSHPATHTILLRLLTSFVPVPESVTFSRVDGYNEVLLTLPPSFRTLVSINCPPMARGTKTNDLKLSALFFPRSV